MGFTIKDMRTVLDQAIEEGLTEETDVIFAHGDPAKGGQVFFATDTGEATRETPDGDVKDFFIALATPQEMFKQPMDAVPESVVKDTLVQ